MGNKGCQGTFLYNISRKCALTPFYPLCKSDAFATLTRKVGKVIEGQCETAQRAVLHGYARGMEKLSLKGTLSLSEGWSFRRN